MVTHDKKRDGPLDSVLTFEKVNDLLRLGLSADEVARAASTSATSIYARRKGDPSRRSDLDVKIGRLYLVASELQLGGFDSVHIVGWLTSPNLGLDGDAPVDALGRNRLSEVRAAAARWTGLRDGEP